MICKSINPICVVSSELYGKSLFNGWRPKAGMMKHRTSASAVLACALFSIPLGFAHAQAGGGARGGATDKVLFEQAQKAMARSDYAEARTLLGTLIDRHPDSAYVPRAKLSIAEAWHSERPFKRAEPEYQDFITFLDRKSTRLNSSH